VVRELVRSLPEPAEQLIAVTTHDRALPVVIEALQL